MSKKVEDFYPGLADGWNFRGNVTVGGTMAVTGATTLTGAQTFTGAAAFTVAPTGPQIRDTTSSAAVGATVILTAADSGKVLINASTSASPSWTLPAKADGLYFTFVCGNTTAGFTITAADAVIHAKTSATGTAITSTTTITNTQGTAVVGDLLAIACDGTAWWPIAQSGIFAAS